jgi:hypothetical protein
MATLHVSTRETVIRDITIPLASLLPAFGLNPSEWVAAEGSPDTISFVITSAEPAVTEEDKDI